MLNGNTVDFAIMEEKLAACASMTTEWAIPWRLHCLVTYALELEDEFRKYHQLRTFPPLPNVPDIGFRAWSAYVTQVEDLVLYERPNEGARGLADWVSVTEQYLHGVHREEHPTSPHSTSRWSRPRQAAFGRKGKQPTGNKSRPASTSSSTNPPKHQEPSRGSTQHFTRCNTNGLVTKHGHNFWIHSNIGCNTGMTALSS